MNIELCRDPLPRVTAEEYEDAKKIIAAFELQTAVDRHNKLMARQEACEHVPSGLHYHGSDSHKSYYRNTCLICKKVLEEQTD
jgi:hypothetical protein